jgi:hypothetical protein
VVSILAQSKHFRGEAVTVLQERPPEHVCGEIPDATRFFVCRGERAPEGFAFLKHFREGYLVGVLCQKK